MDVVQLSKGYRATKRRQFTFYHSVPRSSWYSFNRSRKDERMSLSWSYPVVFNPRLLDWKSIALITTIIGKYVQYVNVNVQFLYTLNKFCIIK